MARQPTGNPGVKARAGRNLPRPAPKSAAGVAPTVVSPSAAATPPAVKTPFNPGKFAEDVRAETKKITWPSWKETWITSVMVLIMVVVVALFLRVVDVALGAIIQQILKLAS